jgi:hypothetical protein
MLISKCEKIKMLEDETFNDFYTKINDLRNSMESLWKKVSDAKIIKNILWSLPECFRIKVTTIEESKELDLVKIEELVGSLQTYEFSLPPVKKAKTIALKAAKKKSRVSSEEDTNEEEDAVAMLAMNFSKLMKNDWFKKKFTERLKKDPKETEPEAAERKDPRGPRCFECLGYEHVMVDCGNLKQVKGKAYNFTLSDESKEEEAPGKDHKFLAFIAPHEDPEESQSYYFESSDDGEELK